MKSLGEAKRTSCRLKSPADVDLASTGFSAGYMGRGDLIDTLIPDH